MIRIVPQFYSLNGYRPLTYLILMNGLPYGYCACWCRAMKAAEWLELTLG
jgi:hypothetical protein